MWVGNHDHSDSEIDEEDAVWSQSQSVARDPTIDFNQLVARINELNVLSGDGTFKIQHTVDGARLKVSWCCILRNPVTALSLSCVSQCMTLL